MYENSLHNIDINLFKSHGSYIVERKTGKKYLDFFNQYSTVPLGYNHPIFDEKFEELAITLAKNKLTNCEMRNYVAINFEDTFRKSFGMDYFNFHYTCTGGLAVESALKLAYDRIDIKNPLTLSLTGSFHGITGLSMFATDKFNPINTHLPDNILYPGRFIKLPISDPLSDILAEIGESYGEKTSSFIVEPIQATYGDRFIDEKELKCISDFCNKYNIPLIFDEIQTGFGTTGYDWYYRKLGIVPDITIFGKKSSVSGIMTDYDIDYNKQELTWDGNVMDMLRCTYTIKAIDKYDLVNNIKKQGNVLLDSIDTDNIKEKRGIGGFIAIDFENTKKRDKFVSNLKKHKILCNPTRNNTVRFRLNLATTDEEINDGIDRINKSLKNI